MIKNSFKTVISLIMLVCIILTASVAANAAEAQEKITETVPVYYVNISQNTATIEINGIKANCNAKLTSKKSCSLKIKMELQKKKSDGYKTVETWTASKTGGSLKMEKSRNINILCDYRLKVTFTAGSETVTLYKYPK